MYIHTRILLTMLAALPFAVSVSAAFAEEDAAAASQPVTSLEEVIVTALRREQSLLRVPIAVSAFDGGFLEDIGAHQLADFLLGAPGTTIVDTGTGDTQIYIRGMSSFYGDGAVGYYLDEVPFGFLGLSQVPDVRTFDLDRIEVLRGPQGTLYGASSLGGHGPHYHQRSGLQRVGREGGSIWFRQPGRRRQLRGQGRRERAAPRRPPGHAPGGYHGNL